MPIAEAVKKSAPKPSMLLQQTLTPPHVSPMTKDDVIAFAVANKCTVLDMTFSDVPGTLHHTSKPIHDLPDILDHGAGFDGSSIRGFQQIQESDMLLVPDTVTAIQDPFTKESTLSVICDIKEPGANKLYKKSPRTIAKQAVEYLEETGIADTAYFGPEAEFFVFDHVSFDTSPSTSHYRVDSDQAIWNTGKDDGENNLGYKIRHKEGYFPLSPFDTHQDLRAEMVLEMEKAGIEIETFHHEVATAGQGEIDMKYDSLVSMADKLFRYKYIVRNVAHRHGKSATFMPKPIFGDNGSGMHTHQSLWKNGEPLFAGDEYAGLSKTALYYMGGLLKHAKALCALCNPTTNSYKRLVPGFEAPVNFIYSARNRSAAIRIPTYSDNPKAKRIEFRSPDATCNPYIALSAMLLAGIDGILHEISPGEATDQNLYEMDTKQLSQIPRAPADLDGALDALEDDYGFLLAGDVFSEEFILECIETKRKEVADERMHPTPSEFARYYDA